MTVTIELNNLGDTQQLADCLAERLTIGDIITLSGHLGAGKTTFSGYFINALCLKKTVVTSPTFNLVQPYDTLNGTVIHADLYRLEQPEELYNLGLEDSFDSAITLIEWPEKADNLLPKPTVVLSLFKQDKSDIRIAELTASLALETSIQAGMAT